MLSEPDILQTLMKLIRIYFLGAPRFGEEDRFPPVAAIHDMINRAQILHA